MIDRLASFGMGAARPPQDQHLSSAIL